MKVLVLEADQETFENVSLSLQLRWPDVVAFSSQGKEGIEMVESEAPDIETLYEDVWA